MSHLDEYLATLNAMVGICVGRRLASVVYGTLQSECTDADVAAGIGWFGGEAKLEFENAETIFVGWGENEGWRDNFSLAIQAFSTFKPGALIEYPASAAPEWSLYIGTPLLGARCLGANETPHALLLRFEHGSVLLADGHQRNLTDGDDILVLPFDPSYLGALPEVIWSTGAL